MFKFVEQILKNRGLTPRRKKENKNPRVKHRMKYRKAKINRRGQVYCEISVMLLFTIQLYLVLMSLIVDPYFRDEESVFHKNNWTKSKDLELCDVRWKNYELMT